MQLRHAHYTLLCQHLLATNCPGRPAALCRVYGWVTKDIARLWSMNVAEALIVKDAEAKQIPA